jgi:hypothetical protein
VRGAISLCVVLRSASSGPYRPQSLSLPPPPPPPRAVLRQRARSDQASGSLSARDLITCDRRRRATWVISARPSSLALIFFFLSRRFVWRKGSGAAGTAGRGTCAPSHRLAALCAVHRRRAAVIGPRRTPCHRRWLAERGNNISLRRSPPTPVVVSVRPPLRSRSTPSSASPARRATCVDMFFPFLVAGELFANDALCDICACL